MTGASLYMIGANYTSAHRRVFRGLNPLGRDFCTANVSPGETFSRYGSSQGRFFREGGRSYHPMIGHRRSHSYDPAYVTVELPNSEAVLQSLNIRMYFCCRMERVTISRTQQARTAHGNNGQSGSSYAKIHMGYCNVYSSLSDSPNTENKIGLLNKSIENVKKRQHRQTEMQQ